MWCGVVWLDGGGGGGGGSWFQELGLWMRFQRGVRWLELRALTAWGKKLLSSLAEWALMLWYVFLMARAGRDSGRDGWGPSQGSQNFKIPGSPSGRYFSDFGSLKINLTSPNKKDIIFKYRKSDKSKCQSKTFSMHKYRQIPMKEFYFTIYRVSAEFFKINLKAIYEPF